MTKARWQKRVGGHGFTVTLTERRPGGALSLYWWDPATKKPVWCALGHHDRERGEAEALRAAAALQEARKVDAAGSVTVASLFARFDADVARFGAGAQPKEDARRMDIWRTALGPATDVGTIDRVALDRFVRLRRRGELTVPGRTLAPKPTDRTIGADLEFLRRVLNWARGVQGPDGRPLVTVRPFDGFTIPETAHPKRPVAPYSRWVAVSRTADTVDPQRLFGGFWLLLDGLGWRVTAICELLVGELDPVTRPQAPFGRVKKRGAVDKEGVEMWVPLSKTLRASALELLAVRATLGPLEARSPLFPSPADPARPWTRHHARDLLILAETAAGLEPIDGGDFHPYRRAWASARKDFPLSDVAAAGGWKSVRTLQESYIHADAETMLAVMSTPRRVGQRGRRTPKLSKSLSKGRGKGGRK